MAIPIKIKLTIFTIIMLILMTILHGESWVFKVW